MDWGGVGAMQKARLHRDSSRASLRAAATIWGMANPRSKKSAQPRIESRVDKSGDFSLSRGKLPLKKKDRLGSNPRASQLLLCGVGRTRKTRYLSHAGPMDKNECETEGQAPRRCPDHSESYMQCPAQPGLAELECERRIVRRGGMSPGTATRPNGREYTEARLGRTVTSVVAVVVVVLLLLLLLLYIIIVDNRHTSTHAAIETLLATAVDARGEISRRRMPGQGLRGRLLKSGNFNPVKEHMCRVDMIWCRIHQLCRLYTFTDTTHRTES